MNHDFAYQRRETYDTFRQSKGVKLPAKAVVDFEFYIEEDGADIAGFERGLKALGFRVKREDGGDTVIASIGPIGINADEIWYWEEKATLVAIKHDYYPDGWELDA